MDRTKPVSGVLKKKEYLGKKGVTGHRRRTGKNYIPQGEVPFVLFIYGCYRHCGGEGKVPVHAMKKYGRSGGMAPLFLTRC